MLLWWILTVPSFLFVAIDIWRTTPESPVLKWAFVILTAFTGPRAFFYVLGCREPLQGTHEQYIATRWRQVLGSTMHCVAGDGIGIVAGAVVAAGLVLSFRPDFLLEYVLGFGFGWAFFQAFAMRDMAGGLYLRSLRMTILPELLSMNLLMTGMVLTSRFAMKSVEGGHDPTRPEFWFIMSMALIAGFVCAYPINWWLVANHLKHGHPHGPQGTRAVDGGHGHGRDVCRHGRHGGRVWLRQQRAGCRRQGRDDCPDIRDPLRGPRHRRAICHVRKMYP